MREVWHAVNNKDVDLLRRLLESGHDVDEPGGYYYGGNIFHIDKPEHPLYQPSWDPLSQWYHRPPVNKWYATPLQLLTDIAANDAFSDADYSKYHDMMRMLLTHAANVEVRRPYYQAQKTPLMEFIQVNISYDDKERKFDRNAYYTQRSDHHDLRLDMISQLLAHNANMYTKGQYGRMPLADAIYDCWFELVETLILHGFDVHVLCDTNLSRTAMGCLEARRFEDNDNKKPPYHRFRPLIDRIGQYIESVIARQRLDAVAIGFAGNHVIDPMRSRLFPEDPELMKMVVEYLRM